MIAHIDRYFYHQKDKDLDRLLGMGYPVQVSAESLFHIFTKKKALEILEKYDGVLISDCHNLTDRRPNVEHALKLLEKKLGSRSAKEIADLSDEILKL